MTTLPTDLAARGWEPAGRFLAHPEHQIVATNTGGHATPAGCAYALEFWFNWRACGGPALAGDHRHVPPLDSMLAVFDLICELLDGLGAGSCPWPRQQLRTPRKRPVARKAPAELLARLDAAAAAPAPAEPTRARTAAQSVQLELAL